MLASVSKLGGEEEKTPLDLLSLSYMVYSYVLTETSKGKGKE